MPICWARCPSQNVLIGTGGILKLADLGISMVLEQDQALTHELVGWAGEPGCAR